MLKHLLATLAWAFTNEGGNVALTEKALREKRAQIAEEMAGILRKAAEDGREGLKSDEEQHWQNCNDEVETLTRHINMKVKQAQIEEDLAKPQDRKTESAQPGAEPRSAAGDPRIERLKRGQEDSLEGLRSWALMGNPEIRPTQEQLLAAQRAGIDVNRKQVTFKLSAKAMRKYGEPWEFRTAQGVGSGGIGGFTVPDEMMRPLEEALLSFGGMREAATVLRTTTGADLPWPQVNDTSNEGAIVAENQTTTEQGVTFTQLVYNAFKYSSKYIFVSVELLQDSSINVAEYLGRALGQRIGRITNRHFTVGDGSSKPLGIVNAATLGATGASGQTSSIIYGDLVDLEHSVDPSYRRPNGRWMMSDAMLKTIKKLVDGQQRPLWLPGIAVREPDTILGYPYTINQHMATPAASQKTLLFGDLTKYMIRDVADVTLMRLDELYALYGQVVFLAFSRHDGDLNDAGTHPVKYYAHPAA